MKCLVKNKVKFFYATYQSKEEIIDEYGNRSGEYEITYSPPTPCFANISAAKGETQTRQFGETESYDKIIVLAKPHPPIDEYSVLWIDTLPLSIEDNVPYDYIVTKVAKSLNSTSIAISKVKVDG